jgi:hypothetical protein
MMAARTFTEEVPQDVIYPDPENESPDRMITVAFEWTAGEAPSGLSGPPENYDPGSGDEFYLVGADLSDEQEERVIEWLDEHWERPDDQPDYDYIRDMKRDDELLERLTQNTSGALND